MCYMVNRNSRNETSPPPRRDPDSGESASDGHQDRPRSEQQAHRRRSGRKERILHTRVSEQLSDDIRRLAEDLRVPASNLVRNVLEEVFTMVESVSGDVGDLFEDILDEAEGARDRIRRRGRRQRPRSQNAEHCRRRPASHGAAQREPRADEAAAREATDAERGGPGGESAASQGASECDDGAKFRDVIGWQPLVLNHAQACARCGVALPRGARAFVGLGERGLTQSFLCRSCPARG